MLDFSSSYLYHYTNFESAIKIVSSKALLFSAFNRLNDIQESCGPTVFYLSEKKSNKLEEYLSNYKLISLVEDGNGSKGYCIIPMWGHYASRGSGVCIVLDKGVIESEVKRNTSLWAQSVKYQDSIDPNQVLYREEYNEEAFIYGNKDLLFFRKDTSWSYEREYRIITISDNPKPFDISKAIVGVILYSPNHNQFIDSAEFKALSALVGKDNVFRFASSILGHSLTNYDNKNVFKEPEYDLSNIRIISESEED